MSDRNDEVKVYQDKMAKAEDYKSSAYTLLLVGILGILAFILMEAGVLPFRLAGSGKYITYGVMGMMFVIFIVMGILSLKSSQKYTQEAAAEQDLTEKIRAWSKEHITADSVKERVWFAEDTPDEMKYFKYFGAIKSAVTQEFCSMNASYLEALCEELYTEIFEEGE